MAYSSGAQCDYYSKDTDTLESILKHYGDGLVEFANESGELTDVFVRCIRIEDTNNI